MCKKDKSSIKTNFYVVRGITSIDDKVLKVFYGGYCHSIEDIKDLGIKALDLFESVMPKALENFTYVTTELHHEDSIRDIPKGVSIEVARRIDIEGRIMTLETVIETYGKSLEVLKGNEAYSSRARTKAMYTDYKAELDWNLKLMEEFNKLENKCNA